MNHVSDARRKSNPGFVPQYRQECGFGRLMQSAKPTVCTTMVGTTITTRGGCRPQPFCAPERRVVAGRLRVTTRGGCRPRFEPRSRHEDAAGHSALTLNKLRGCGPSSNYDTQSKPQEGAGLAHQSRRRARDFGKSPRNLMAGSEPVWGNGLGQRLDTTFLRARAACGCGPSSNYDTRRVPATTRIQ